MVAICCIFRTTDGHPADLFPQHTLNERLSVLNVEQPSDLHPIIRGCQLTGTEYWSTGTCTALLRLRVDMRRCRAWGGKRAATKKIPEKQNCFFISRSGEYSKPPERNTETARLASTRHERWYSSTILVLYRCTGYGPHDTSTHQIFTAVKTQCFHLRKA